MAPRPQISQRRLNRLQGRLQAQKQLYRQSPSYGINAAGPLSGNNQNPYLNRIKAIRGQLGGQRGNLPKGAGQNAAPPSGLAGATQTAAQQAGGFKQLHGSLVAQAGQGTLNARQKRILARLRNKGARAQNTPPGTPGAQNVGPTPVNTATGQAPAAPYTPPVSAASQAAYGRRKRNR